MTESQNNQALIALYKARKKLTEMKAQAEQKRTESAGKRPCMEQRHKQYWSGRRAAIKELMIFLGMEQTDA